MVVHLESVRASLQQLMPVTEPRTKRFLTTMFDRVPSLETMLLRADFDTIEQALRKALVIILGNLDNPAFLESYLFDVGKRHRELGMEPEQLPIVVDSLVTAVRETIGPTWTLELEEGWTDTAVMLLGYMQAGMTSGRPLAPTAR